MSPVARRPHVRLTTNSRANEHLTFSTMHARAAAAPRTSPAQKRAHKEAAAMHLAQAAVHLSNQRRRRTTRRRTTRRRA